MEGPPLGPGGEDITWPDQVAPGGRKASSTRKIKPQTSNLVDKQVFDYRQWEVATAELRVHVPMINDKSPFICARLWHKKPPADPMGSAGHDPALFLKLFDFFTHGLFPKGNCKKGLVSLWLSIRNWLQDTNPIGTPFCLCFFQSPTNDFLLP